MKKYLLTAIILVSCTAAWSQDDRIIIEGTTKISKKLTPRQVVDSLNKRFPNAKSIKYYKVPPDAAKKGWTVTKEDDLTPGETIDFYTISFKRADLKYYGLFAADGRLIRSRMEETTDKLPDAVKFSMNSLGKEYPGYKVISKKYYKNLDANAENEYYEIIAKKDKVQKSLYYKKDGTLVNIK